MLTAPALLAAHVLLASATPDDGADKRTAVLIGNWDYGAPELDLNSPPHDLDVMEQTLRALGFSSIIRAENANRPSMISALQTARRQSEGGVLFVYYSGHAIQVEGTNWLLPVGERLRELDDVTVSGISVPQALRVLRGARLRVVVLDACRNNPFSLGGKSFGTGGLLRDSLDDLEGTIVSYAAAPGTIAYDGKPGEVSPFTRALSARMVEPGVDLPNLFMNARGELKALTRDAPRGPQRSEEVSSLTHRHRFELVPTVEVDGKKEVLAPVVVAPRPSIAPIVLTAGTFVGVVGLGLTGLGGGTYIWSEYMASTKDAPVEAREASLEIVWPALGIAALGGAAVLGAGIAVGAGATLAFVEGE
jgi:hypothetical protein